MLGNFNGIRILKNVFLLKKYFIDKHIQDIKAKRAKQRELEYNSVPAENNTSTSEYEI